MAIKVKRIDHVAVAVGDMDKSLLQFETVLALKAASREVVASQATEAALLRLEGASIELVAPQGNEGLARFLEKRGPGLHHIAVEVEGIDEALLTLAALGVPLIDQTPRVGARGHLTAFIHPKATGGVLIELVEPAPTKASNEG